MSEENVKKCVWCGNDNYRSFLCSNSSVDYNCYLCIKHDCQKVTYHIHKDNSWVGLTTRSYFKGDTPEDRVERILKEIESISYHTSNQEAVCSCIAEFIREQFPEIGVK